MTFSKEVMVSPDVLMHILPKAKLAIKFRLFEKSWE